MVLDSNMNFSRSIHEASIASKQGQALTFNEFIAPYAARHDDLLGLGANATLVKANLQSVGRQVTEALIPLNATERAESYLLTSYLATLKAAMETQRLLDQNKTLADIADILQSEIHIPNEPLDAAFKLAAQRMVSNLQAQATPGYYEAPQLFYLSSMDSVFDTVVCNDEPLLNKDQDHWVKTGFALAQALPIVANAVARQPCIHWKDRKAYTKPTMEALQSASVLMLQSQYDVPTPSSGALETFAQLPAARMVYVENEGGHGLLFYGTECVDLAVYDHLLGKPPAPRQTTCQGKPLALDEKPAKALGPVQAAHFSDPEQAQRLYQRLRQGLDATTRHGRAF